MLHIMYKRNTITNVLKQDILSVCIMGVGLEKPIQETFWEKKWQFDRTGGIE